MTPCHCRLMKAQTRTSQIRGMELCALASMLAMTVWLLDSR